MTEQEAKYKKGGQKSGQKAKTRGKVTTYLRSASVSFSALGNAKLAPDAP